jgi:hypothetical protein
VRARRASLLDQRHRHLAEPFEQLLVLGEQLHQPVGAGQAGRAAAHDGDPDLDALILGVLEAADELLRGVDGWRVLDRCYAHAKRLLVRQPKVCGH